MMDEDDADYMQGSDEDYGFDYSDDQDMNDAESADVENQYYTAKSKKEDDPEGALKLLRAIVDKEEEKGDWGFKALKQCTKLLFLVLNRPAEALKSYSELLTYTKSAVTRNYSEKTINGILDYVGGGKGGPVEVDVLQQFYETTLKALEESKNDRLSAKTRLKLGKLWLDRAEYSRLQKVLDDLYASTTTQTSDGSTEADQSRSTQLLEIYALEIQMHNEMKNVKKLKEIYNAATLAMSKAIPHPRILGIIKECGGKMWMGERQWHRASEDFFDSFKNYDEAGSFQRIAVLKYLVLANMLTGSAVNPSTLRKQNRRSLFQLLVKDAYMCYDRYKSDPQIVAMTSLVDAYQRREVHEAEKILKTNKATIMDDAFIRSYIGELLRSLRTQFLIDLLKPYTRVELSFLARQLNVPREEVEELLINLILEGKVQGKINQVSQRLELDKSTPLEKRRFNALQNWADGLEKLHDSILSKTTVVGGRGGPDGPIGMMDPMMGMGSFA